MKNSVGNSQLSFFLNPEQLTNLTDKTSATEH
ncbi:hypothetical protein SPYJRS4_0294 [Streptococcus pyogenes JRS4]|uniref:Uncharacterized protein n=1 Tax=Streptococcus pyogenes serotype M12 (strain MGAS9429) TaxID=370551 RepID=Q1JNB0_STRPC|nr:hypothetical protein MGAS9429_Spy0301 [Streptococcus pyogenes MGAS9429]ABF33362.1 hypothetical protein MGAS10270_Spy0297 [Streptococcus pyogenes MGAS10270]ABF35371.1 hypothetical cytosolic protein [Streptococcus pyogenes MGAS2096]ABF37246.1 hypothetical protein MGAS10750_Spy0296 [Streptococcus pyogenes MGAS10750]BAR43794.1 hypothetical protein SPYJRS4_0294 [Streptococcus pyogenes JRS4]